MRLRLDISTRAAGVPWCGVVAPGRGFAYDLLERSSPKLGRQLHYSGWGPHGMTPMGHGAPTFPFARRRRGVYAAGGPGVLEFGSPLPAVVGAWASVLRDEKLIDWGGVAVQIDGLQVVDPPDFASGYARFRTETPVVMKGSGRDASGRRQTRQDWLLPTDDEFPFYFEQGLRRKAETLGLLPEIGLEKVTWFGPKRSFSVGPGAKVGAAVEVDLVGDPDVLQALWSWGLGQANSAGFGWVVA